MFEKNGPFHKERKVSDLKLVLGIIIHNKKI